MGYSKYSEDILDRWVEDTRDIEDLFYRQWNLDHIPAPPPPPGQVELQVDGKRLEDEEVFPIGRGLKIKAVVSGDVAPVEIMARRGELQVRLRPDATQTYTLPATRAGTEEVDASSGAYHRRYTIHFVEVAQIDRVHALATEISRFTSNPPGWTRDQFDSFRARLGEVLAANAVPQSFANGLVEYFLGVQLEAQDDPAYTHRLETAYVILRRFAAFSDIAAAITEYFRYRTNTFSGAPAGRRPLSAIIAYFATGAVAETAAAGGKRGVELVVPEVEYSCMQAAHAMIRQDPQTAIGLVSVARKLSGRTADVYRSERLRVIEARAHMELGDDDKARALYQSLVNSPCPRFQAEASKFLGR